MFVVMSPGRVVTFVCDASAEEHLASNVSQLNPKSIYITKSDNRIKAEILVPQGATSKVTDYLKQHYLKQYNGVIYIVEAGLLM